MDDKIKTMLPPEDSAAQIPSVAPCYTLSLTETQMQTLSMACEMVSRLYMAQTDVLGNVTSNHFISSEDAKKIKYILFPESQNKTTSFGIASREITKESKQLWDIYQVLRYFLSWKDAPNTPDNRDWKNQMSVSFDEPMKTSDEPMPVIIDCQCVGNAGVGNSAAIPCYAPDKYFKLYHAVNLMIMELGATGEIYAQHELVENVMDALHDIDGGVYRST